MPGTSIRKVVFTGPRQLRIETEPSRGLKPREVRIRTFYSGISRGTEMNIYRGEAAFFNKAYDPDRLIFIDNPDGTWSYPTEFGYENVGQIEEVGSEVTELSAGITVVTYRPHREECIVDLDSRDVLLGDIIPVLPLPDSLPAEHGVFIPLLGVAFNALLDAQILLTETVVIFGAGVVGLLTLQLALRAGAGRVYVVEPTPSRRDSALRLGAEKVFDPNDDGDISRAVREMTGDKGADVAIEASGNYRALQESIRIVGYNGRVVAAGWLPGAAEPLHLGEEFHLNRVRIVSSQSGGMNPAISDRWDKARRTRALLSLVSQLNFDGLITHWFPIEQAAEAYKTVDENPQDVLQVVLTYGE